MTRIYYTPPAEILDNLRALRPKAVPYDPDRIVTVIKWGPRKGSYHSYRTIAAFHKYQPNQPDPIEPWWEAAEGQWIRTTDGVITQVLGIRKLPDARGTLLFRIPFATVPFYRLKDGTPRGNPTWENRPRVKNRMQKPSSNVIGTISNKKVTMFAVYHIIMGLPRQVAYMRATGTTSLRSAAYNSARLIKSPTYVTLREYVVKKWEELLEKEGLTDTDIAKRLKSIMLDGKDADAIAAMKLALQLKGDIKVGAVTINNMPVGAAGAITPLSGSLTAPQLTEGVLDKAIDIVQKGQRAVPRLMNEKSPFPNQTDAQFADVPPDDPDEEPAPDSR